MPKKVWLHFERDGPLTSTGDEHGKEEEELNHRLHRFHGLEEVVWVSFGAAVWIPRFDSKREKLNPADKSFDAVV